MALFITNGICIIPRIVQSFGSSTLPRQTPSGTLLNLENNKEKILYSRLLQREQNEKCRLIYKLRFFAIKMEHVGKLKMSSPFNGEKFKSYGRRLLWIHQRWSKKKKKFFLVSHELLRLANLLRFRTRIFFIYRYYLLFFSFNFFFLLFSTSVCRRSKRKSYNHFLMPLIHGLKWFVYDCLTVRIWNAIEGILINLYK